MSHSMIQKRKSVQKREGQPSSVMQHRTSCLLLAIHSIQPITLLNFCKEFSSVSPCLIACS